MAKRGETQGQDGDLYDDLENEAKKLAGPLADPLNGREIVKIAADAYAAILPSIFQQVDKGIKSAFDQYPASDAMRKPAEEMTLAAAQALQARVEALFHTPAMEKFLSGGSAKNHPDKRKDAKDDGAEDGK